MRLAEISGHTLTAGEAGALSILFDVGGVLGGITAGYLSDYLGASAIVASAFVYCTIPILYMYRSYGEDRWTPRPGLCGRVCSGSAFQSECLKDGAGFPPCRPHFDGGQHCAHDDQRVLCQRPVRPYHHCGLGRPWHTRVACRCGLNDRVWALVLVSNQIFGTGSEKALATVTAIIDGMGSLGAALGPFMVGYISSVDGGFNNVFYMLYTCCLIAGLLIGKLFLREVSCRSAPQPHAP